MEFVGFMLVAFMSSIVYFMFKSNGLNKF